MNELSRYGASNEVSNLQQQTNGVSHYQEVDSQRAIQEVQAAYVMAKKFPRNENQCLVRIVEACKRRRMAEGAIYSYPKGGKQVSGPSIRLAEVVAKHWGNLDYGVVELQRDEGRSLVRAYCLDLETNTIKKLDFTVEHSIDTKKGRKQLTDSRDIYEIVANQGARRLRNCILAIIPEDITEEAMEVCEKTLASADNNIPIGDRIKKMVLAFAEFNVTTPMMEAKLGHKIEATQPAELVNLQKIYRSIKDGFAPVTSYFDQPKTEAQKAAAPVMIFSRNNLKQVDEVTQIMDKMKIPKDSQEYILNTLEGKDQDAHLMELIAEVKG